MDKGIPSPDANATTLSGSATADRKSTTVNVLQFSTIMLFALVMGVFWGTWFSLSRTMAELPPGTFLDVGHAMIRNLGGPMSVLMPLSLASAVVLLILLPKR
jgi:hypothetical protein